MQPPTKLVRKGVKGPRCARTLDPRPPGWPHRAAQPSRPSHKLPVELNRFAVDVQYTRRDSPSQSRGPSTFRRVHLGAQAARGCFVGRHALRPAWTRVRSWRSVPAQSYPCLVPPPPARPVLAVGPPPPHCKAALGRKSIGARRVPMRPPTPGFRSPARRIAKPSPIESP